MDCLFCRIIDNKIPSYTIYEDNLVKVFLDISPNTNGHCLLVPKKHIVTLNEMDNELMTHILKVEKEIYKLLIKKLNIKGLTVTQNNDLGQAVKHFHIHLIPRYEEDNLEIISNKNILEDINELCNKINK